MNKKSLFWQIPLLLFLIVGTFFIARQQRAQALEAASADGFVREQGTVFGTFYNVTYQSPQSLMADIEAELQKVDREFSMFNDSSTVSAINRGEQPPLSDMFQEVYDLAQQVNAETQGAFDITVAPLVNAWGFGFKHEQMPTPAQVDSLLQIRSQLDFSAIAKGYGSDLVARLLLSRGIENFMIEVGGEIVTHGKNPGGTDWKIGVQQPADDTLSIGNTAPQAVLQVGNTAMATSGNYRNFYYKGGRKYAHTIDPRTGYPVEHELLSATVLAPTCAEADAYATSFMVLGLKGAQAVLDRHPELTAYLIYTDANGQLDVWYSPRLKPLLRDANL